MDQPDGAPAPRLAYSYYVLFVLFLGYVTNCLDRTILNVLLPAIQKEFALSYTQLGLLGGLSFALFYTTCGIPLASLADRTSRKWVLAASIGTWSVMTAACGLAGNFVQLLLARVGTAVGEAGGSPPSHSLIADYFTPERRGTALSIYALGVSAGAMVGLPLGGLINDLYGWRYAFLFAGVPGILVMLLVIFTVREPVRSQPKGPRQSAFAAFPELWNRAAFRNMALGAGLHSVVWYGAANFNSVFLNTYHGMTAARIGVLSGFLAIASAAGTFVGGVAADRLNKRTGDPRWYMTVPGLACLLGIPFQLWGYLAPTIALATIGFAGSAFFASFFFGPSFAATQGLSAPSRRAVAAAILLFIQTLIGLGLGPVIAGFIADSLKGTLGLQALRVALALITLGNLWAALHYWLAAKTVRRDMAIASVS